MKKVLICLVCFTLPLIAFQLSFVKPMSGGTSLLIVGKYFTAEVFSPRRKFFSDEQARQYVDNWKKANAPYADKIKKYLNEKVPIIAKKLKIKLKYSLQESDKFNNEGKKIVFKIDSIGDKIKFKDNAQTNITSIELSFVTKKVVPKKLKEDFQMEIIKYLQEIP